MEGLRARVRHHCDLATTFANWVRAEAGWEVLAPVGMSVVCFRHRPAPSMDEDALERHNAAILESVNQSGKVFLSHTKLNGRYVLRVAIGNLRTEESHLAEAWRLLRLGAH
jgi:aromatic-L-amino-acid decarboxylase